jgi:hypothetical protein
MTGFLNLQYSTKIIDFLGLKCMIRQLKDFLLEELEL